MTNQKAGGIQYISRKETVYPERLKNFKRMPKGLYVLGRLPADDKPSIAIVGSRRSTNYGNEIARFFAKELALAGVQIISGMAWGIDGMAHEGALEAGGDTFAVLGSGVDICYPAGHRKLYEKLISCGGVLSEQLPGMAPLPGHFPARNRIISGLSDLVLVVEAKEKSGALITADFALEQGKDVFAVPGRIKDPLSAGCLNLLKQGAGLADSPFTILEILGISGNITKKQTTDSANFALAKEEDIVYSCIGPCPVCLDELVQKTHLPVQKIISVLVGLELKGCIREIQKNEYVRTDLRATNGEISGYR